MKNTFESIRKAARPRTREGMGQWLEIENHCMHCIYCTNAPAKPGEGSRD